MSVQVKGRDGAPTQVAIEDDAEGYVGEKVGTVSDRKDMRRLGKVQEFRRNFSFISIFGFAAVLMQTWEATLAFASYALPNGGRPALIYTYMVAWFGFGAAILSMAEMASMAPTSGGKSTAARSRDRVLTLLSRLVGQYHWVSEFAPRSTQRILSYIVGWFSILAWAAGGIAGQCFSVGLQIEGLIILNSQTYEPQPWHLTLLAIGAVAVCVIFNTLFARKLPAVETVMLVFHTVGFFAILVTLWILAPKAPSKEVWTGLQVSAGWPSTGLAFMVGITGGLSGLLGPDAAVHMSEEVRDASRLVPKAMIWTLAMNGLAGLVMSITFAYCLGPLEAAVKPEYGFAFIGTFYNATNSKAGTTVMTLIITILTLCCAIDNVATGSRQLFAFARDGGVPFARTLSYVIPGWDIPLNAVLLTATISALLTLINLGSSVAFNAILSIGVVSLLGSYLISISCILIKRLRGEKLLPCRWSLGRNGLVCNVLGVTFLAIGFLFAFFPLGIPVTPVNMNWASAVYGGVGLVSLLYYLACGQRGYVPPVARLAKDL